MKKKVKNRIAILLLKSGIARLLAWCGGRNYITVFYYHRVDTPDHRPWLAPSLISCSPEEFDRQMRLLRESYAPVSVEDVLAALNGESVLPKRAALVTVDDGYRDFAEHILPIASQYDIQPLLFVPTAYVGEGVFWWDKMYQVIHYWDDEFLETPYGRFDLSTPKKRADALESFRMEIKGAEDFESAMTLLDALHESVKGRVNVDRVAQAEGASDTLSWDELRALSGQGAHVAAHTHTHPLLTRIPFEEACTEIATSQKLIHERLGYALPVFAFPDGQRRFFSPELVSFLKGEGFEFAVTTIEGGAKLREENALFFPRVGVYRKLSLAGFAYRLTPIYKFFSK